MVEAPTRPQMRCGTIPGDVGSCEAWSERPITTYNENGSMRPLLKFSYFIIDFVCFSCVSHIVSHEVSHKIQSDVSHTLRYSSVTLLLYLVLHITILDL